MGKRVEFGWCLFTGFDYIDIVFRTIPKGHALPAGTEWYAVIQDVVVRADPSTSPDTWPFVGKNLAPYRPYAPVLRCNPKDLLKAVRREHNKAMRELRDQSKAH